MPCYQQVKNHRIGRRRFTRTDIPPDTREVSAGVFHHPFRVFRLEGSLPAFPGKTAGFAVPDRGIGHVNRGVDDGRGGFYGSSGGCGFRAG